MSLADDIISLAKAEINQELSETLYVSLTDHLYNLFKLHEQGITVTNRLSWEIKKFYPQEFEVGKKALERIGQETGVVFEEEEAGNIAMHLINAQVTDEVDQPKDVQSIAKRFAILFHLFDFLTRYKLMKTLWHSIDLSPICAFFFQRLKARPDVVKANPLLGHVSGQYADAYKTMLLIEKYLGVPLNDDEKLYLTLHIQKLIENE